jgi:hypothetical protein
MPDISFRQGTRSDAVCIAVLATQVFLDTYAIEGIRPPLANEALENYSPDAISGLFAKMRLVLSSPNAPAISSHSRNSLTVQPINFSDLVVSPN